MLGDVLDHLERDDGVERPVGEPRQVGRRAGDELRRRVVRAGVRDGLLVDVDPGDGRGGLCQQRRSEPLTAPQIEHAAAGHERPRPQVPVVVLIDDLRVGTAWEDVTPSSVPEPASAVVMGLGVLGLLARRFRQR